MSYFLQLCSYQLLSLGFVQVSCLIKVKNSGKGLQPLVFPVSLVFPIFLLSVVLIESSKLSVCTETLLPYNESVNTILCSASSKSYILRYHVYSLLCIPYQSCTKANDAFTQMLVLLYNQNCASLIGIWERLLCKHVSSALKQ